MGNSTFIGFAGPVTNLAVGSSRNLLPSDNGRILEMTADELTLTFVTGLQDNFTCTIIPHTTTYFDPGAGTTANGGTDTLTRSNTSNVAFSVMVRASDPTAALVTGY